jgi:hypothetical protein
MDRSEIHIYFAILLQLRVLAFAVATASIDQQIRYATDRTAFKRR